MVEFQVQDIVQMKLDGHGCADQVRACLGRAVHGLEEACDAPVQVLCIILGALHYPCKLGDFKVEFNRGLPVCRRKAGIAEDPCGKLNRPGKQF